MLLAACVLPRALLCSHHPQGSAVHNDSTQHSAVAFYQTVHVFSDNIGVLFTWLISSIPLLANSKTSSLGWTAVVMAAEVSEQSLRIPAPNTLLVLHVSTQNKLLRSYNLLAVSLGERDHQRSTLAQVGAARVPLCLEHLHLQQRKTHWGQETFLASVRVRLFEAVIWAHICVSLKQTQAQTKLTKGGCNCGHISPVDTYTQEITGGDVLETLLCLSFGEEGGS